MNENELPDGDPSEALKGLPALSAMLNFPPHVMAFLSLDIGTSRRTFVLHLLFTDVRGSESCNSTTIWVIWGPRVESKGGDGAIIQEVVP